MERVKNLGYVVLAILLLSQFSYHANGSDLEEGGSASSSLVRKLLDNGGDKKIHISFCIKRNCIGDVRCYCCLGLGNKCRYTRKECDHMCKLKPDAAIGSEAYPSVLEP
ncbi:unnamed protein product [Spirodela intermedia]|uniref:Meg domain-containing protein n=2 Tax=Spirodela intermedia TaxID=51605 RepID=A0A7I8KAT8_SPIIN|nr:unnamed protein product [Spirodela intermedia]CAA6658496.1 unnamed protein product [Spirodela intermedia]CAA7394763.1 unnamed protein product [Spirodela intermedia]